MPKRIKHLPLLLQIAVRVSLQYFNTINSSNSRNFMSTLFIDDSLLTNSFKCAQKLCDTRYVGFTQLRGRGKKTLERQSHLIAQRCQNTENTPLAAGHRHGGPSCCEPCAARCVLRHCYGMPGHPTQHSDYGIHPSSVSPMHVRNQYAWNGTRRFHCPPMCCRPREPPHA